MKKIHYWVVASWYVGNIAQLGKNCRGSESIVLKGEEQLQVCINDFLDRKLKQLSFQIKRVTAEQLKDGWNI